MQTPKRTERARQRHARQDYAAAKEGWADKKDRYVHAVSLAPTAEQVKQADATKVDAAHENDSPTYREGVLQSRSALSGIERHDRNSETDYPNDERPKQHSGKLPHRRAA
jgi:hypothetical protein